MARLRIDRLGRHGGSGIRRPVSSKLDSRISSRVGNRPDGPAHVDACLYHGNDSRLGFDGRPGNHRQPARLGVAPCDVGSGWISSLLHDRQADFCPGYRWLRRGIERHRSNLYGPAGRGNLRRVGGGGSYPAMGARSCLHGHGSGIRRGFGGSLLAAAGRSVGPAPARAALAKPGQLLQRHQVQSGVGCIDGYYRSGRDFRLLAPSGVADIGQRGAGGRSGGIGAFDGVPVLRRRLGRIRRSRHGTGEAPRRHVADVYGSVRSRRDTFVPIAQLLVGAGIRHLD